MEEIENPENFGVFRLAIKHDFGLDVAQVEKITSGYTNKTYKANLGDKEVFIRIDRHKGAFPREIAACKLVEQQGVPVPEVVDFREKPEMVGYPTMIVAKVMGEPIGFDNRVELYTKAGEMLRRIHSVAMEGFGDLVIVDEKLKGMHPKPQDFWDTLSLDEEMTYIAEGKLISDKERTQLMSLGRDVRQSKLLPAALLHADYHGVHIFTDGQEITGVIDWGSVKAGDPRLDIAISLFFFDPKHHRAFREGYGELAKDPLVDRLVPLVAAYKVAGRHRKGRQNAVDRALATLRQSLNSL